MSSCICTPLAFVFRKVKCVYALLFLFSWQSKDSYYLVNRSGAGEWGLKYDTIDGQRFDKPGRSEEKDPGPHFPFVNPIKARSKEKLHMHIVSSTVNKTVKVNP